MAELFGRDVAGGARLVVAPGQRANVAVSAEETLLERGWFPLAVTTTDALRAAMVDHLLIVLALRTSAALAAVVVGALSLVLAPVREVLAHE